MLKGRTGGSRKQRKGPLRKIVVFGYSQNIFSPPLCELECGHEVCTWGQYRARCSKCAKLTFGEHLEK